MRHTRKRTSVNAIPSIITTSVVTVKKMSILRKSFIVVAPLYAKSATSHADLFHLHPLECAAFLCHLVDEAACLGIDLRPALIAAGEDLRALLHFSFAAV